MADNEAIEKAAQVLRHASGYTLDGHHLARALSAAGLLAEGTALDGTEWDYEVDDLVHSPGGWPSGNMAEGKILGRYADRKRGHCYVVEWPNTAGPGTVITHMRLDRLRPARPSSLPSTETPNDE
jgi:hypothetical protein